MELKFSIDTDDIFKREIKFEHLLTEALKKDLIKNCKNKVASEEFKKFSKLAEENLMSQIKLRLENFLSEEVALTESWGKPIFVGSIEDLIKKRFDDLLLRPVDNYGKTLQGCTSSGKTWVEWTIEETLKNSVKKEVDRAASHVEQMVKNEVKKRLIEFKDGLIKDQVDNVFTSMISKRSLGNNS